MDHWNPRNNAFPRQRTTYGLRGTPGWRKEHQRAVAGVAVGKQHWERAASVFQEKQGLAPPTKKEKLL